MKRFVGSPVSVSLTVHAQAKARCAPWAARTTNLAGMATRPLLGGAGGRKSKRKAATTAETPAAQPKTLTAEAAATATTAQTTSSTGPVVQPPSSSPPASTPLAKPKRKRSTKGAATPHPTEAQESTTVTALSVDVEEMLAEWRRLRSQRTSAETAAPSGAHASPSTEASMAERAAAMSAILRTQEDYPQLHTLFFLDKDMDVQDSPRAVSNAVATQFELSLAGAEGIVRNEAHLEELLAFLHVYRQLSRQSPWMAKVLRQLGGTLLEELTKTCVAVFSDKAPRSTVEGTQRERDVLKRCVSMVLLELRRSQFRLLQGTAIRSPPATVARPGPSDKATATTTPADTTAPPSSRKGAQRRASPQSEWPLDAVERFLLTAVRHVGDAIAAGQRDASSQGSRGSSRNTTLSDTLGDTALLLLATHVAETIVRAKDEDGKASADALNVSINTWRVAAQAAEGHVDAVLDAYHAVDQRVALTTPATQQRQVDDVLLAILLCRRYELTLPAPLRQRVCAGAVDVVRAVCDAVAQQPEHFPSLCRSSFTAALEALRATSDGIYEQLCTHVFGAAASFLSAHDTVEAMGTLVQAQEAAWREALAVRGATAPPRPPLHTPLAHLCYALMCSGFAPAAVMASGLCIELSAVDLADVTNAGALFSLDFAVQPLPTRVHTALTAESVALARKALTLSQRAVHTATDMLMRDAAGLAPFAAQVEAGGAANALPVARPMGSGAAAPRQQLRLSQSKRIRYVKQQQAAEALLRQTGKTPKELAREEEAVAASQDAEAHTPTAVPGMATKEDAEAVAQQAYYVCVATLVEALCRGDTDAVSRVTQSLFPLLEVTGSTRYLVEAVELVCRRVRERLTATAALQKRTTGDAAILSTTRAMETAFANLAGAVEARIYDSVFRGTLKLGAAPVGGAPSRRKSTRTKDSAAALTDENEEDAAVMAGGGWGDRVAREAVEEALALVARFTPCALTLGMQISACKQLTTLHTLLLAAEAAATSPDGQANTNKVGAAAVARAFRVVKGLDQLMDRVHEERFPVMRHPESPHARSSAIALNRIVAVQLDTTKQAAAAFSSTGAKRQHGFLLGTVHLLYRLAADFPVETEPPQLRHYRTMILDPALATLLAQGGVVGEEGAEAEAAAPPSLTTLTEIAVVMCRAPTIHHVSRALYEGLTRAVVAAAKAVTLHANAHMHHAPAQRLLGATAAICLRADPTLTADFLRMATVLGPWLTSKQAVAFLDAAPELQVPAHAAPLLAIRRRLTRSLTAAVEGAGASTKRGLTPPNEMVAVLDTLARYDLVLARGAAQEEEDPDDVPVPYGPVFLRLCRPEPHRRRTLGLRQCGRLVHVAATLAAHPDVLARCTEEAQTCILQAPRRMAVVVLQAPQQGIEHDIAAILTGYAAVTDAPLRNQVMRAFILRTVHACAKLSPVEVVECVEAYCAAGIEHEYLFSVLLGRAADTTQSFSMALSLRLLRCGTEASRPQVRQACLTAAQPVFARHVRHLLESDPQQLVTVGTASATILATLRTCFPQEEISAAVLECIAAHHKSAGLAVLKAALELIAARGSQDYTVLRTLADYCTAEVLPSCDANDLADTVCLLALCGIRSGALVAAITARFPAVAPEAGGYALGRLALALETASVDADPALLDVMVQRTTELVDGYLDAMEAAGKAASSGAKRTAATPSVGVAVRPPFTSEQAATVLRHLRTAGRPHFALVVPAVDALLTYLGTMWSHAGQREDFSASRLTLPAVDTILAACVEQASEPQRHAAVVQGCASRLVDVFSSPSPSLSAAEAGVQGPSAPQAPQDHAGRTDLSLLTNLVNHLVRASTNTAKGSRKTGSAAVTSQAVQLLLAAVYERRGALLKRQLLQDTIRQTLAMAGEASHPQLYALVVAQKLV